MTTILAITEVVVVTMTIVDIEEVLVGVVSPRVHFNDEDFHEISNIYMESNDNENTFVNHGPFGQHHDHH
jgi:hypothetical protein